MKYLMAFFFAIIPALFVGAISYLVIGPMALLIGWAVFGLGMEVCLFGSGRE